MIGEADFLGTGIWGFCTERESTRGDFIEEAGQDQERALSTHLRMAWLLSHLWHAPWGAPLSAQHTEPGWHVSSVPLGPTVPICG